MSDSPKGPGTPQVLVRGGTTSARHDRQRAERQLGVEQRRAHQDRQVAVAKAGPQINQDGASAAKLHSLQMHDRGSPQLVLRYMNRDGTVRQECISEYVLLGNDEAFTMVCPRCLERGEAQGESQMLIRKSHRKFYIDSKKAGSIEHLSTPDGLRAVRICGTVTCDDTIKCMTCGVFQVKIVDSQVWPA